VRFRGGGRGRGGSTPLAHVWRVLPRSHSAIHHVFCAASISNVVAVSKVFSLDYRVDPPLSAVIHPSALRTYRQVRIAGIQSPPFQLLLSSLCRRTPFSPKVFHLLWRLKRGEFVLSAAWRQHMMSAKVTASVGPLLLLLPLHLTSRLHPA
jgi:hypothetical protein